MHHKALLISLASTALALHGTSSHSHLGKRFTFPLPSSKGSVTFDAPKIISGNSTFDGGMKTYGRGVECTEGEGGDSDAVFWVENGGTLKNAIIGADQIEGVHCMGACTIENVWWEAVCEGSVPTILFDFTSNIFLFYRRTVLEGRQRTFHRHRWRCPGCRG